MKGPCLHRLAAERRQSLAIAGIHRHLQWWR